MLVLVEHVAQLLSLRQPHHVLVRTLVVLLVKGLNNLTILLLRVGNDLSIKGPIIYAEGHFEANFLVNNICKNKQQCITKLLCFQQSREIFYCIEMELCNANEQDVISFVCLLLSSLDC